MSITLQNPNGPTGKLAVIGSVSMFSDKYFNEEDNAMIFDVIISILSSEKLQLNAVDAQDPEIDPYLQLPDISRLANNFKSCLEGSGDISTNVDEMFDQKLYSMDMHLIPKVIE